MALGAVPDTEVLIPHVDFTCVEDLASAERLFASTPCLPFRQAWRSENEDRFQAGRVSLAWSENALLVFARMEDLDIFNDAKGLNQRAWLLGDTFEIFLQDEEAVHYVEFHVTPDNSRVQLRIPGSGRAADAVWLDDETLVESQVWISTGCWHVFARIPATSVSDRISALAGRRWHFSLCRYDYERGNPHPVLSSTSPITEVNFHRLSEWKTLKFAPTTRLE